MDTGIRNEANERSHPCLRIKFLLMQCLQATNQRGINSKTHPMLQSRRLTWTLSGPTPPLFSRIFRFTPTQVTRSHCCSPRHSHQQAPILTHPSTTHSVLHPIEILSQRLTHHEAGPRLWTAANANHCRSMRLASCSCPRSGSPCFPSFPSSSS